MTQLSGRIALWPKKVNGVKNPQICLDGVWRFTMTPPADLYKSADLYKGNVDFSDWNEVQVPGELSLQGFDIENDKAYPYARTFFVPEDYRDSNILLRFESVHSDARVWVNGKQAGSHCGPATVWDCDITGMAEPGQESVLIVEIEDRLNDPSILSRYARHNTGGILRSVTLMAQPRICISSLHIDAGLDSDFKTGVLDLEASVSGADSLPSMLLLMLVSPDGQQVKLPEECLELENKTGRISLRIPDIQTWDAEHPRLYKLSCRLMSGETLMEEMEERIGFRRISFGGRDGTDSRKVYINGQEIKLRGVCLHDYSWDKGRVSMPEMSEQDVAMLKNCNVNYIRTSHYPPPKALVAACDRHGIYLEVETAICFQHGILSREEIDIRLSRFIEMVEANRNHPSAIIWSLGNESSWNDGINAEYDWIKANDTTRPLKFSWPQTIYEEVGPMDLFSVHYVHFMDGLNATHDLAAGDLPYIHDEFAHLPNNNPVEIRRDPNAHNFWGESIKRYWEELYTTQGALGGALWAAKDDAFFVPENIKHKQENRFNDITGMGGWGCIWDAVGAIKPEAWLVKKAYSPIRINEKQFSLPEGGTDVEIKVTNWFNHTSLSEIKVEWSSGADEGSMFLPCILPGDTGIFTITGHQWEKGEELDLKFITPDGIVVDEHKLTAGEPERVEIRQCGEAPVVQESPGELTLIAGDTEDAGEVRLILDKKTGMIRKALCRGEIILTGGPHLHLIGVSVGTWRPDQDGVKVQQQDNKTVVTITGAYGNLRVCYRLALSGNGILEVSYELLSEAEEKRELSEAGISFDLPDSAERIEWKRDGLWTAYPEDHIGRNRGVAFRVRPGAADHTDRIGVPQPWPWKDNMRDFYFYKKDDLHDGLATFDYRSMKEHILYYSVGFSGTRALLEVIPAGDAACRMSYEPWKDPMVHAADGDIAYEGPWERMPLTGYNGSTQISCQAGASATLTFDGAGVRIFGLRYADAALMRVMVDGKPHAMVNPALNAVGAQTVVDLLYEIQDLPEGRHKVKVTVADSHFGKLGINYFEILHKEPKQPGAKLIINKFWNYPQLDWGNFVKPAIRLNKGLHGKVSLCFK